jgi:hypothetical protein
MNLEEFKKTLSEPSPSKDSSVYLKSLWYDAKGDWNMAHDVISKSEDKNAAWVHAYLHRKEGDVGNADYWYRQAGKKRPDQPLEKEWEELVISFLNISSFAR